MTRQRRYNLITRDFDDNNGGVIHVDFAQIQVKLENKEKHRTKYIDAWIDSGSFTNLFPSYIADALRIDLKSVNPRDIRGIGTAKVTAYRHKVAMSVGPLGLSDTFETEIDFSEEIIQPLLGLNGFFDKYHTVCFNSPSKEYTLIKDLSNLS